MKAIVLTRGRIATVDDEDFDRVNQFKWYASKEGENYYAARTNQNGETEFLHWLVAGKGSDHKNGDGLDDRRENLRPATQQQNNRAHRRKALGTTSRFRGVCQRQGSPKWIAQICVDRQEIRIGTFDVEEDAARAYDKAARELFGEFASPNFAV